MQPKAELLIAAINLAAEIEGHEPAVSYDHQLRLVIDEGGKDSIYLHQTSENKGVNRIYQGRFWGWAKQIHSRSWPPLHSLKSIQ